MNQMDPWMDPITAVTQCLILVRAMRGLTSECDGAQLNLTRSELDELLSAVENKVLVALSALKKMAKEPPAPRREDDAGTTVPSHLWEKVCSTPVKVDESPFEIPIERRATLDVSVELAHMLAKAVRKAGYPCDSISSALRLSSEDEYQIACNYFARKYGLSGKKGSWSVTPD